jgi:hypothetical protein
MNSVLLAIAMVLGAESGQAAPIPDGSLIFLEHSDRLVEIFTGEDISHVGMVLHDTDRQPWLYEATPGEVRKIELEQYLRELGQAKERRMKRLRIWLVAPATPYTADEVAAMQSYLDSQVGRRYSVKGYVRRKEGDGIHCSQLMANTLRAAGQDGFDEPHRVNPGQLWRTVTSFSSVAVEAEPVTSAKQPWCVRAWNDWLGFSRWCKWSCYETWTFCR